MARIQMIADVLGIFGFLLSLSLVVVRLWHYFRRPRFWATFVEIPLDSIRRNPDARVVEKVQVALGFVGGGRERTIVDSGISLGGLGMAPLSQDVHSVPAQVAGKLQFEMPGGAVLQETPDSLDSEIELDTGTEVYTIPFTLSLAGDSYRYLALNRAGRVLPFPRPQSRRGRMMARLRNLRLRNE